MVFSAGIRVHAKPETAFTFRQNECSRSARICNIDTIKENLFNLSIPLYVQAQSNSEVHDIEHAIEAWKVNRVKLKKQTNEFFGDIIKLGIDFVGKGNKNG